MTTTTVFADVNDGFLISTNSTYSTARSGGTLSVGTTLRDVVGQTTGFECYEAFLSFDTSSIPDDDYVTTVVFSLYLDTANDFSVTDFSIEARQYSWSAGGLTTDDWIAGASLSSNQLLATLDTSTLVTGYNDFYIGGRAFSEAINKTGVTDIMLDSSRHVAGNQPPSDEYVGFQSSDTAGTTQDPKLVITHVAAETNSPRKQRVVSSPMRW